MKNIKYYSVNETVTMLLEKALTAVGYSQDEKILNGDILAEIHSLWFDSNKHFILAEHREFHRRLNYEIVYKNKGKRKHFIHKPISATFIQKNINDRQELNNMLCDIAPSDLRNIAHDRILKWKFKHIKPTPNQEGIFKNWELYHPNYY
jgi:hypothetical protein